MVVKLVALPIVAPLALAKVTVPVQAGVSVVAAEEADAILTRLI